MPTVAWLRNYVQVFQKRCKLQQFPMEQINFKHHCRVQVYFIQRYVCVYNLQEDYLTVVFTMLMPGFVCPKIKMNANMTGLNTRMEPVQDEKINAKVKFVFILNLIFDIVPANLKNWENCGKELL